MKSYIYLVLVCASFSFTSYSQYQRISVETFTRTKVYRKEHFNYSEAKFTGPILGMDRFSVGIRDVFIDTLRKMLFISGKTYFKYSAIDSSAECDINICTGTRTKDDSLVNIKNVGVTFCYNAGDNSEKYRQGDFDVIIDLVKNRQLYFHRFGAYVVEFDIDKLLNNNYLY